MSFVEFNYRESPFGILIEGVLLWLCVVCILPIHNAYGLGLFNLICFVLSSSSLGVCGQINSLLVSACLYALGLPCGTNFLYFQFYHQFGDS